MEKRSSVPIGAKIGAVIGFVFFLIYGLVPGFFFGSSTAILLLSKLIGPVQATTLGRVAVVIGALMGLFCAFSVCVVAGALVGSTIAYLTDALAHVKRAKEESAKEESSRNKEGNREGGVS